MNQRVNVTFLWLKLLFIESNRFIFSCCADLDSIASAVAYSFFLSKVTPSGSAVTDVPVISIPRSEFRLRTDVTWLLSETGIDAEDLVFQDEAMAENSHFLFFLSHFLDGSFIFQVDMEKLFDQNKLQLILVDHNVLKASLEVQFNHYIFLIKKK